MSGEFSITLSVPMATRQSCLSIWATFGMPAPSTPFALGQITIPVPLFATSDISFSVAFVICTTKSGFRCSIILSTSLLPVCAFANLTVSFDSAACIAINFFPASCLYCARAASVFSFAPLNPSPSASSTTCLACSPFSGGRPHLLGWCNNLPSQALRILSAEHQLHLLVALSPQVHLRESLQMQLFPFSSLKLQNF